MTLFRHELKSGRISLLIWSLAVSFMLLISVLIYPVMETQMGDLEEMIGQMGDLSGALGLDVSVYGSFWGYLGTELGDTLGLGGALFAALISISMISKEEKDRTAEFLLTHPISRAKILTSKLCAMAVPILVFELCSFIATILGVLLIGQELKIGTLLLLFSAYALMQLEIACICFGVSAFLRRGGVGIGLGISFGMYFLKILSNLDDDGEFLNYVTPFGYADGAAIVSDGKIEFGYLIGGIVLSLCGVVAAYLRYSKKDIS